MFAQKWHCVGGNSKEESMRSIQESSQTEDTLERHRRDRVRRTGVYSPDWGGRLAIPSPSDMEAYKRYIVGSGPQQYRPDDT